MNLSRQSMMMAGLAIVMAGLGALFAIILTGDNGGVCAEGEVEQDGLSFDSEVILRPLCVAWEDTETRVLVEAEFGEMSGVLDTDTELAQLQGFEEGSIRVADRGENRLTLVLPPAPDRTGILTLTQIAFETDAGEVEVEGSWRLILR